MTDRVTPSARMTEYDGLRGVAAFAVLWAHVFAPLFQGGVWADNAIAQALWFSPLHFIDGSVAVYIFFALSGYVLARMFLASGFDYGRWVPSRVTRLLVPILAAIALNLVVILVLRGVALLDQQNVKEFVPPWPGFSEIARDAVVIFGSSGTLGPLWTMQWEMIFSLLLPLFVLVALRQPLWLLVASGILLSAVAMFVSTATSGSQAIGLAVYMPMFLLGVGLASHDVDARTARVWNSWSAHRRRTVGGVLVAVVLVLLSAKWFVLAGIPLNLAWNRAIDLVLVLPGVVFLLIIVRRVSWVAAILNSALGQWLGRISFSLYLTHVPFWIATITILGQSVFSAFVALAIALAGSYVFCVLIERRAHRWARSLNRRGATVLTVSDAVP